MGKYDILFKLNLYIQNFGGKLLSVKRFPFIVREKDKLMRNRELFQFKNSDTCYILGLGPSLKQIDLKKLHGDTIATNRFYRFDADCTISPTYYMMMDNDFFSKGKDCLIHARTQYPDSAFVLNGKYSQEALTHTGESNTFFMYSWKGLFSASRELSITKLMPVFGNIVCCAIAFAMSMGYKRIILLGCDFNSFATQKVQHCYAEAKDAPKLRSLAMELFCYSFEAEMHNRLAEYANNHGISIENGTPTSLIDSYPFLSDTEQSEISK